MSALVTRAEALVALAHAPFVVAVAVLIVAAVLTVSHVERRQSRNPYMKPWADRRPGDLNGGRRP